MVETNNDTLAMPFVGGLPGLPETTTAVWPSTWVTPATLRWGSSGTKSTIAAPGERLAARLGYPGSPLWNEIHLPAYAAAVVAESWSAPSKKAVDPLR